MRFAPGQAPALPELDDVWARRGRRLAGRITAAGDRPSALVAWALRAEFVRSAYEADRMAGEVARRLGRGDPVEHVADAVGLSAGTTPS